MESLIHLQSDLWMDIRIDEEVEKAEDDEPEEEHHLEFNIL